MPSLSISHPDPKFRKEPKTKRKSARNANPSTRQNASAKCEKKRFKNQIKNKASTPAPNPTLHVLALSSLAPPPITVGMGIGVALRLVGGL